MAKDKYNATMDSEEQVEMEEKIAAMIFDTPNVEIGESAAGDLGREILKTVLKKYRPDYFK
jgi:hypothetical protein